MRNVTTRFETIDLKESESVDGGGPLGCLLGAAAGYYLAPPGPGRGMAARMGCLAGLMFLPF